MSLSLRDGGLAQQNTVMAGQDELQKLGVGFPQALSFCIAWGVQHSRRVTRITFAKQNHS